MVKNLTNKWRVFCPQCSKHYSLPPDFHFPRKVRCKACDLIWVAESPEEKESTDSLLKTLSFEQNVTMPIKTIPITAWSVLDTRQRNKSENDLVEEEVAPLPSQNSSYVEEEVQSLDFDNPFLGNNQKKKKSFIKNKALIIILTIILVASSVALISIPGTRKSITDILGYLSALSTQTLIIREVKAQNIHHKDFQLLTVSGKIENPSTWSAKPLPIKVIVLDPTLKKTIDSFKIELPQKEIASHGSTAFSLTRKYELNQVIGPVRLKLQESR